MKTDKIFLDKQRFVGDRPADQLVKALFSRNLQHELYTSIQLTATQIVNAGNSTTTTSFLNSKRSEPEWFQPKRLESGQHVFETYAVEIMTLLGVMALPYCYAGSPGNKALYFSEKMRNSPGKRLIDTADFIISVSGSGSLVTGSAGHIQINKTRLIHAIARHYVSKNDWSLDWGVPINQEDMAGTNLAFSYVTLVGLLKSGFVLSTKEKEDFVYLWRYIGYHLGINEQLLPATYKEAQTLTEVIKQRNFRSSDEGIVLTRELLRYYRSVAPAGKARFIESQVRYFLGPEVSGYLGLAPDYLKDRIAGFINSIQEVRNFLSVPEGGYRMMMEGHEALKRSLQART